MDQIVSHSIKELIQSDPAPTTEEFLDQDAPSYEMTTALITVLLNQLVTVQIDPKSGTVHFTAKDGAELLQVLPKFSGTYSIGGLLAIDFSALLSAIRIHEVESFDLVMLPPDIRKAELENFCRTRGTSVEQLHRFLNLWIAAK